MTCKLLQLGSNNQDYGCTFHPGSLFLSNFFAKKVRIFTSVLNERQTLGLASYYNFGLMFRTMIGPFT